MGTKFTARHDRDTGLVQLLDIRGPRPMLLDLLTRHEAGLLAGDLMGFPATPEAKALSREEEAAEIAAGRA